MDILTFSDQLQLRLKSNLAEFSSPNPESPQEVASLIRLFREAIQEMTAFVNEYIFKSIREEIEFFKTVKPVIMSQYLYYRRLFTIRLFEGYKQPESRREIYERELLRMEEYARKHREFFLYCMSGSTSDDERTFLRRYSGHDQRLATMLCHEMLRPFLITSLKTVSTSQQSTLSWTGKKSELIELLFALHATGTINSGKAEVKQIAGLLEQSFQVDLGNYYDYLKSIRLRKKGTTVFLDAMKDQLMARLEKMDD